MWTYNLACSLRNVYVFESIDRSTNDFFFVCRNWNLRRNTKTWWKVHRDTHRCSFLVMTVKWHCCPKTYARKRLQLIWKCSQHNIIMPTIIPHASALCIHNILQTVKFKMSLITLYRLLRDVLDLVDLCGDK